ncbi:SDR family NAD(P)-dependent oxidoreductase [Serratia nevei]|uniref:SDR family NAD(P)-dependent oxidoreductase n=1 Tax=Serratia nevei TaxID=2703794 RepID=UPI00313EEED2
MKSLSGKTAPNTGAGSSLGSEISLLLVSEGASIGGCDLRLATAEKVVREIQLAGGEAMVVGMDVSDDRAVNYGQPRRGDALMRKSLRRGLLSVLVLVIFCSKSVAWADSARVSHDTLGTMEKRYVQMWQSENGPLTATPPAPLARLLTSQPKNSDTPAYDTLSSRDGLAALTQKYVTDKQPVARIINVDVAVPGRKIPVRIYNPHPDRATGVIFFIHGGGHLSGSVDVYDPISRHLAAATGNTVVAVDYRRAPESPYPEGLNDARDVLMQVYAILDQNRVAWKPQLTLAGDSGGGAFSATLAGDLQVKHPGFISRLVLIYPSLDYTLSWPSADENGQGKLLDKSKVAWYFSQYFQHNEDRKALSPLYRPVTRAFPPTLIFSGGLDPLRDEDFAFVARLKAAGVPVKQVHFPGMVHAFLMLENLVPQQTDRVYRETADFITAPVR